ERVRTDLQTVITITATMAAMGDPRHPDRARRKRENTHSINQFLEPLAKSRPPQASERNGPKAKGQVGVNQSVSARQFAIFILQFSFCNSLLSFSDSPHPPRTHTA